jgi:hypothetical protein
MEIHPGVELLHARAVPALLQTHLLMLGTSQNGRGDADEVQLIKVASGIMPCRTVPSQVP